VTLAMQLRRGHWFRPGISAGRLQCRLLQVLSSLVFTSVACNAGSYKSAAVSFAGCRSPYHGRHGVELRAIFAAAVACDAGSYKCFLGMKRIRASWRWTYFCQG